jgi:hypothetical protein
MVLDGGVEQQRGRRAAGGAAALGTERYSGQQGVGDPGCPASDLGPVPEVALLCRRARALTYFMACSISLRMSGRAWNPV